MTKHLTIWE